MIDPNKIYGLSKKKSKNLDTLIDYMEKRITKSSSQLTKSMYKNFIYKLKQENGVITDIQDAKSVLHFNTAYNSFSNAYAKELLKLITIDLNSVLSSNADFYRAVAKASPLAIKEVKGIILSRLGIKSDGTLIRDGYLNGIFKNETLRGDMFKLVFSEITKGVGYESLKNTLKNFIEGDDRRIGAFKRHYKTYSYDVYSHVNAFNGALYAEKLGLKYFIYNGGIIKTSRKFCIERNGKVYSSEEAKQWKHDIDLTAIADKETYNWKIERGGYGCRHSIDYIPYEVAVALRNDLKE